MIPDLFKVAMGIQNSDQRIYGFAYDYTWTAVNVSVDFADSGLGLQTITVSLIRGLAA